MQIVVNVPKNTMRLSALCFSLGLLLLPTGAGAAAAPDRPSPSAASDAERQRLSRISDELAALADTLATVKNIVGLSVVMVHDGHIVLARGAGTTTMDRGEQVDADTVFRVASLSKGFAATVAAQIVREGAMHWDMLVQPWLPGLRLANDEAAAHVTLRDVLSHRVGLPYNALDRRLEANEPYPLLVQALPQIPMTCGVGDCYGYQNIAFSLVGDLIFATTGEFYSFQVERRIFEPLGMRTATYGRDALEASSNWARPHTVRRNVLAQVNPKDTYYRVAPAAGINASANDLGQWLIANLGDRPDVLPADLLAVVQDEVVETPHEIRGNGWRRQRLSRAGYGLGWRVMDYAGHRLVFHAGAVEGYRAMLGFLPDQHFGFAVVWNSEVNTPAGLLPVALDRALGLPSVDWLDLDKLDYDKPDARTAGSAPGKR